MKYSTVSLRKIVEGAGGTVANRHGAERDAAKRDLAVARIAYNASKALDESPIPITQDQADYICSVIAERVRGAK